MNRLLTWALFAVAISNALVTAGNPPPVTLISASFSDPQFPETGPMLPTTIAGVPSYQVTVPTVIRDDNWNDLVGPMGIQLDLWDSFGMFTSVDVDWMATDTGTDLYTGGILNGDSTLMNGHLLSSTLGATGLVTITLLELDGTFDVAAGYDLFIYADTEGANATQSLTVDDGIHLAMSLTMTDNVDAGAGRDFLFATDYDDGTLDGTGVWARFSGLTGSSLRITAESVNPGESAFINGFQIVGTPANYRIPGDGNGDGWVDGLDYLIWASNFGAHPGPDCDISDGDYNDDGWVDGLDYLLWAGEYGNHTSAVVPEPGAWVFLIVGCAVVALRRKLPS